MQRFSTFIALLTMLLVGLPGTAAAAAAPKGITVTPAIEQLVLTSGGSTTFTTQLSNNLPRTVTLALSAEDFTYLNQNGAIRFVDPSLTPSSHSLAAAIRFDRQLVRLEPNETATVSLQITHPDALSPGGHYAAIVYREVDPSGGHGIIIGLESGIATLLFVQTAHGGTTGLKLITPIISGFTGSIPLGLSLVLADTGNTQTTAHGLVRILTPGGELLAQGVINVDSGLILPGAERLFTVTLASQNNRPWWPGLYQLEVLYRRDGQTAYQDYTETFLYVDSGLIVGFILIGLAASVVVLRRFGRVRSYLLRR